MTKPARSRRSGRMTIPGFFEGKSIFITGGTGFLGKVLVEKLLRSCPKVGNIYLLMRPKKGKSLEERLAEIIALPLYIRLKRENEHALKKIIPLKGDVTEKNLGLSEEDQNILIDEVSIVFHVAATVRFDTPLKDAVLMNTRGTLEVLKLAKKMANLKSFTHVSTTYCNTHKKVIEERIYPAPGDWKTLIKLAENLDRDELEIFAPKILVGFPNTYTYTKGLAEHVVKDFQDFVPSVIFRPSIVISSHLEPTPGWIDNFNGPVGLMVASGKGVVRVVHSDPKIKADYIPVDLAVKAMIVVTWERATSWELQVKLPVYNASSYAVKSISQQELVDLAVHVTRDIPLDDVLWTPCGDVTKCKPYYYIKVFLLHIIPALIIDTVLKLTNRKPIVLKLQRKIFVANMALTYFLTQQWTFKNEKLFEVDNKVLEEDTSAFSFKIKDVDLVEFFKNCVFGARKYLLHQDNINLPEAVKHSWKMYWIDKAVKFIFLMLLTLLAIKMNIFRMISGYLISYTNLLIKFLF